MAAARDDFAVALHGYALAGEIKSLDKLAAVKRPVELMGYAVDGDRDHGDIGQSSGDLNFCSFDVWQRAAGKAQKRSCALTPTR